MGTLLGSLAAAPRCPSGPSYGSIMQLDLTLVMQFNLKLVMLYYLPLLPIRGPSGSTHGSILKVILVVVLLRSILVQYRRVRLQALLVQAVWIKSLRSARCSSHREHQRELLLP